MRNEQIFLRIIRITETQLIITKTSLHDSISSLSFSHSFSLHQSLSGVNWEWRRDSISETSFPSFSYILVWLCPVCYSLLQKTVFEYLFNVIRLYSEIQFSNTSIHSSISLQCFFFIGELKRKKDQIIIERILEFQFWIYIID